MVLAEALRIDSMGMVPLRILEEGGPEVRIVFIILVFFCLILLAIASRALCFSTCLGRVQLICDFIKYRIYLKLIKCDIIKTIQFKVLFKY